MEEIYGREDQQPDQAIGVVNSDINVAALTKYLDLLATMHPSHKQGVWVFLKCKLCI